MLSFIIAQELSFGVCGKARLDSKDLLTKARGAFVSSAVRRTAAQIEDLCKDLLGCCGFKLDDSRSHG
ncbi:MAG: hypothetical protein WBA89_05720 [Microcoleus sp.]|uniref:hypothetical protein n=1 Tax=Microcoleus sp. TaxID=44472 RepID=UPI003C726EFA